VELNGALSNPFVKGKFPDLAKLAALVKRLRARQAAHSGDSCRGKPRSEPPAAADKRLRLPRRQGAVLASVTTVLERTDQPMLVGEVHAAVERLLGELVPRSSVKDALSAHAIGGNRQFRRIRRGCYELARGK